MKKRNKDKKNIRILITLIVVIIVAVGFVVFTRGSNSPDGNSLQSTILNTDSWKTFQAGEGTITFKAPTDFIPEDGEEVFSLNIPETKPYFETHLIKEARIDVVFHDKCTAIPSNPENRAVSTTDVVLNGTAFTKSIFEDAGAGNAYKTTEYAVLKDAKCYEISLFLHSTNGEALYTDKVSQIKKVDAQHSKDIENMEKLFESVVGSSIFVK
ncbi:MAG: hypothetical protein V4519_04655 [Patescibacteria group bacterium]